MTDRKPHPQAKTVQEPATGRTWPSVADLVREIGAHPNVVYRHLSEFRNPRTVYGRSFQYVKQEAE